MRSPSTIGCRPALLVAVAIVSFLLGCTKANSNYCDKASACTGGRVCNLERKECLSPDAAVGPPDSAGDGRMETDRAWDVPYASEVGAIDAALVLDGKVNSDVAANVDGDRIERGDSALVDGQGPDLFVIESAIAPLDPIARGAIALLSTGRGQTSLSLSWMPRALVV
jgi:hypothetical protein